MFQLADDLHFVPSARGSVHICVSPRRKARRDTYSDRTRAAVVDVLDLCTSLTAILLSWSGLADDSPLGWHSQTLPQLPKPIYMS